MKEMIVTFIFYKSCYGCIAKRMLRTSIIAGKANRRRLETYGSSSDEKGVLDLDGSNEERGVWIWNLFQRKTQ